MKKSIISIFLAFTIFCCNFYCIGETSTIDYYGVFSSDADKNMIKMTEDLFFSQLKEFGFAINDYREKLEKTSITEETNTSEVFFSSAEDATVFYTIIKRKGDALSKWECKICIKNLDDNSEFSLKKEYDSFYKILMESKPSLSKIFNDFSQNDQIAASKTHSVQNQQQIQQSQVLQKNEQNSQTATSSTPTNAQTQNSQSKNNSTEKIAGSWQGEDSFVKCVIMRSGKGFIIFRDGASMNICVELDEATNKVNIRQVGNSNASFFPELERSVALEAAKGAKPIEWDFSLSNENKLSGTKTTMLYDKKNNEIALGKISVTWYKN